MASWWPAGDDGTAVFARDRRRPDERTALPKWWADPRRAFLVGLGIGVIVLLVSAIVVNRDVEYAADHGLEAMTRWRPEAAADVACLIDTIEASPDLFSVGAEFELVPPKIVTNEWFVLRTDGRTLETRLADGVVTIRAWPADVTEPIDCG